MANADLQLTIRLWLSTVTGCGAVELQRARVDSNIASWSNGNYLVRGQKSNLKSAAGEVSDLSFPA